jgi:hypothetical protein
LAIEKDRLSSRSAMSQGVISSKIPTTQYEIK